MLVIIDAVSNIGSVRKQNEDMALVQGEFIRDSKLQLHIEPTSYMPIVVAVADGIGGHNGGELASELAISSLDEFVHLFPSGLTDKALQNKFNVWVKEIHQSIVQKGIDIPEFYNMGTTLVGILIYDNRIFWFNVGDSRLYRVRDKIITQISSDHSARKMMNPNAPSNLICNSIGAGEACFIDFYPMNTVFDDDTYILCSDGLNDMISDDEIDQIIIEQGSAQDLVDAAIKAGGNDNVTVVTLSFLNVGR